MLQTTCPSAEELRQWTCGDTDESASNTLADHLQQCEQCQSTLAELDSHNSDSLIQHLKADDPLLAFRDEHDCQQASILAMGAITGQSLEETHTALPVFPKEMNDYRVLGLIAAGGMGKVYRAHHQRLGRDVAIKILSGRRLTDANASVRFEQEIRALGRLSHPNIVSALDARQCDGNPILIMEFVDGLDLSQIVKRLGPLPASSVAAIGRAVAAAIAYASNHGLVHRDIKPSNIMISANGEVKLLDLGLARIQLDGNVAPEWTGTGLTVGTPDYMSPEQINDLETIDSRSDMYSLGCTLYRLLVGQPPYAGKKYRSNFEKLAAHVSEDPIVIPNTNSQYPAALVAIIQRLLAKSPADRPESVQSVALELEKLSSGADLAGLLAMARKLQANETEAASQAAPLNQASNSRGRIPPYVAWALALGGVPAAFFFGIWLSIKNPDGSETKVQVPNGANASIDDQGNVQIDMAKDADAKENKASTPSNNREPRPQQNQHATTTRSFAVPSNIPTVRFKGSLEHWAAVLKKEQSIENLKPAVEAIVELADHSGQSSQAIRPILEKCREMGGNTSGSGSDSDQWMNLLSWILYPFFPKAFLEEALHELPQANQKSLSAIVFLCTPATERFFNHLRPSKSKPDVWSSKWPEVIDAISKADTRLSQSDSYSQEASTQIINDTLTIADQLGIPFSKLDSKMQAASKREWAIFLQSQLPPVEKVSGYPVTRGAPWLPYWRTLPQTENHKTFIVQAMLTNYFSLTGKAGILTHFEKFTSEEQSAICNLLARRYQATYSNLHYHSFSWEGAIECLRRCSSLSQTDLNTAEKVVNRLRDQSNALWSGKASNQLKEQVRPETFARLLGVQLGEMSVVAASNNESPKQSALPNDLESAIEASASSSEPLFRGHNFDQWATSLKIERSSEMLKIAVEALFSLAETPEQKSQVMRLILEKSRSLGSTGGGAGEWMDIVARKLPALSPQPFLDEAIRELPQANEKSLSTIVFFSDANLLGPTESGQVNSPLSDKLQEFCVAVSNAMDRLNSSNSIPQKQLDFQTGQFLTFAGTFDIPFSKLDPLLQKASEKAWQNLEQSKTSGRFVFAPWLPYWKTLPQTESRRVAVLQALVGNSSLLSRTYDAHFKHIGTLTPDEQSEFCNWLVEQFRKFDPSVHPSVVWSTAFACLRSCSTLEKANIDQAAAIIQSLRPNGQRFGNTIQAVVTDVRPATFARLLGVPGPEVNTTSSQDAAVVNLATVDQGHSALTDVSAHSSTASAQINNFVDASSKSDVALYHGQPFDAWMKALQNEQSFDVQLQAGEAVILLSKTPEEKLAAARLIMQRSRTYGGFFLGNNNDSEKWMGMLRTKVYTLLPNPLLTAMIEEVPKANQNSAMAVICICRGFNQTPYFESGYRSDDPNLSDSPLWLSLITELTKTEASLKLQLSTEPNLILKEALLLSDRLGIPYSKLDVKLQNESKRYWEELLKREEPHRPSGQTYTGISNAPWLPYWFTLPQSDSHKAFLVGAIFDNVDNIGGSTQRVLDHFEVFTPQEEAEVCEVLSSQFENIKGNQFIWRQMSDCLKRCSNLERSSIVQAIRIVNSTLSNSTAKFPRPTDHPSDVKKFRQLLGLPPKVTTNAVADNGNRSTSPGIVDSNSTIPQISEIVNASSNSNVPLFRGHPFEAWIKTLENEESFDMRMVGCEAVIALARNPEQRLQAAKEIFRISRELGGLGASDQNDSEKWMLLLMTRMDRLGPGAMLQAAIEEVPQANQKSLLAIFNSFHKVDSEQFLDPRNYGDGTEITREAMWAALIHALAQTNDRVKIDVPGVDTNYLLRHTLLLADLAKLPFASLDQNLKDESKRLWEKCLKEPIGNSTNYYMTSPTAAWLPYWSTLAQSENHKAFMVQAIFDNRDNVRTDRQRILKHFEKFTREEQTEVCEILAQRYTKFGPATRSVENWQDFIDCLRRCSNLDKANIDAAEAMVEESETSVRDVNKFRELLGLPPKPITMPTLLQPLFEKQQGGNAALKNNQGDNAITLDSVGLGNLESGGAKQAGPKDAEIDAVVQASAGDGKPLFRGHPLSAWLKVLERERTYYLLSLACEASITLAENDEELLQVARALLKKNRQIGEFPWEQSALDNWMILLQSKVMYRIFPKHFVVAAIDEMDVGNKRSIHTILKLATTWPDRNKYFLSGPETERANEELHARWKTLFEKLSAAEKYFDMTKTKDGLTQRDEYIQDMIALAARLDVEYSSLSPLLQAEMKQAWDRNKQTPIADVASRYTYSQILSWFPYWKSLPQSENNKAQMIGLLYLIPLPQLQATSKEVLDHFEKFTPDEQKEIAKLLVVAYCECKFVTPEQAALWNDIFACLKRCSSFDPKKIDEAEAKVKEASKLYLQQTSQGQAVSFPLTLKPIHLHELLDWPYGTVSPEDSDFILPEPKPSGYGASYYGPTAYGGGAYSSSGPANGNTPYAGGYRIAPITSNGQSSTSQAYGGSGNQTQPTAPNQSGTK